jgi:hypothetical protein
MRDQDVQDREGLKLISQVVEPLKGWVSIQKIPSLSVLDISRVVVMPAHSKNRF